jgi:hypothetical protein
LGVVLFVGDYVHITVRVVGAARGPRTAIRALLKLTGWSADAYLIDDDTLEDALSAYRPVHATAQFGEAITVAGVAAAAARVADTAVAGRALTMRSANCDRYTWVRLEGPTHVSDLLVSRGQERVNVRRSV